MADALCMDVGEGATKLVNVQLDEEHGDGLLLLGVVTRDTVDGLWNVLKDKVKIDFILLVTGEVEEVLEGTDVGMVEDLHDLQLTVLEALVLKDLFNGNSFICALFSCLEDDAE